MLGRKTYIREEYDHAKAAIEQQLAAYERLAASATTVENVAAALRPFETMFFSNMVLVLDRYFMHRLRVAAGKDANPLNEVEMLSDSLMNNGGVLRGNNVIKWVPDQTVLKLRVGDRIELAAADFERLSAAFLAELERRFLP